MPARHLSALSRWIDQDALDKRPPRAPWTPPTDEEREQARKDAQLSLKRSHLLTAAWLARPCPTHNAKPGEFCIAFVHGLCGDRIGATDE